MSITVLIASHLATAGIGMGGAVLYMADKMKTLRRCQRQLIAIAALETPGAAAAAKKMAAIARGTHPLVRELGRSPIAPRSEVVADISARNRAIIDKMLSQ